MDDLCPRLERHKGNDDIIKTGSNEIAKTQKQSIVILIIVPKVHKEVLCT